MGIGLMDVLFPVASANMAGIGAASGKKKYPGLTDSVMGEYGYSYNPEEENKILNSWYGQRSQDLAQNSMEGLVNQQFGTAGDELKSQVAANTQNEIDQSMQYGGLTTGQKERAIGRGGINQLNTWAGLQKEKTNALLGARQSDIRERRALDDKKMSSQLAMEQAKQSSWGRQGGIFS